MRGRVVRARTFSCSCRGQAAHRAEKDGELGGLALVVAEELGAVAYAVFLPERRSEARVRVVIDALLEHFERERATLAG